MLSNDYLDEVLQWPMQLVVPASDLPELHNAEIEEESLQLRLEHIQHIVLVTRAVAQRLIMIELEPEGHYLVVEVRTGLDELDVEVRRRLSCGGGGYLHLLLYDLLFLFFQFVNEV